MRCKRKHHGKKLLEDEENEVNPNFINGNIGLNSWYVKKTKAQSEAKSAINTIKKANALKIMQQTAIKTMLE